MKHIALITALAIFILTACGEKPVEKPIAVAPNMTQTAPPIAPGTPMPPGHPDINSASPTATLSGMTEIEQPEVEQTEQATVVSVIDIPQFSYIEVKQNHQTRWIASSTLDVRKGDVIQFDSGSTMTNFNSKTLNRTFPSITFVNHATIASGK